MSLAKIFVTVVFAVGLALFFGGFGNVILGNTKNTYLYLMATGSTIALGVTGISLIFAI